MPKIVRFYEIGEPEVLKIEEVPLENPGPGEVRLRVEAFGLNRSEVQYRRGVYPLLSPTFPSRLGKEAAGVIDALGPDVEEFELGERISTIPSFADMQKYGVYGETAVVPASALAAYPPNLSTVQAAAIWQQYLTAYAPFIEYTDIGKGKYVLITAAPSSVGRAGIEIAKLLGATVIATTRKGSKKQALLDGGADYVVVTAEEDLVGRVMEITSGTSVDMIFDRF